MAEKKDIWLRASVVGSLWASVEIIMGSFFHNLQLPIAGTLLAGFTVVFIIAILQIWPYSGMVWRAGLICALMKSISPSAVILGPMTGIFLEALLIELIIFIFGKNIFAYLIAGAVAVSSALFHKLITLLIIYGLDTVRILVNLYHFSAKQLNIENISPKDAFYMLIVIYVGFGLLSSLAGYFIGAKAKKIKKQKTVNLSFSKINNFLVPSDEQKYSVYFLVLNIVFLISGLYLINFFGLVYGSVFVVFYLIISVLRYKNAFRQFKRPLLWLQLILLTIISSLFYMENGQVVYFTTKGLIAGIEMTVRAIIVILAFSAISVELRNPIIRAVLYNKGFANLYDALGLAFSALPAIINDVAKPKNIVKKPFESIVNILLFTDSLYTQFVNYEQDNNN